MTKIITLEEAVDLIQNGDTLLIGGFLGVGSPDPIIDALAESGKKDFTLVASDTGFVDKGIGKMVVKKQFKKIYASHIGTNRETGRQMNEGETEVILVPQGTLAEKIRAKAYGLGGVLTPTGVGTQASQGKPIITLQGKDYILEEPIGGDVSILYATIADKAGNLCFHGATQNFNIPMAGASKINIVFAQKVVEIGELDPDHVRVPGVLIDYIIDGGAL